MPIKKRGDSLQVTVCWKGQVHRRSSRQWTRDQAREVETKLLNDLHALDMGRQPRRSFLEATEKWVEEELPNYRDPEREMAHMAALAPFLEGRMLDEAQAIAGEAKKAWQAHKPGTVNRRLALLRRLVNLAWKEWGWLDQPIGQKVSLLNDRGERHVYPTTKQAHQLAARMPRAGGYVLLAGYTGIRRGQLLGLTRADVVNVPRIGLCINLGTEGKSGAPQLIPLHPAVRALGRRLPLCSSQVLRDEWEAARDAEGLDHVRFNDLRHAAASWLLQSGASLMHVRDLLGHSDVRVTQRYAHLQVSHLREALHKVSTPRKRRKARKAA